MPVYNAEVRGLPVLEATLASIEASREYCLKHYPYADQLSLDIVLVDDASSDATAAYLHNWASQRPHVHVVTQPTNQGVAAARNAGVAQNQAQAFFFCDADDRYLEPHILTGVQYLNRPLDPNLANPIYRLLGSYPAAVKTAIHMADPIHPYLARAD
ncbi:MAG: glycosyltransferase family 2 protein [Synechococcaceae cyanobacterium SM2_3_60]|nr:glycosyltransferase family 2 protein [Synechococcaceae cyanobacterium SM2_3_60]